MNEIFRETLEEAKPIRLTEPLAEKLGAMVGSGTIIDYSFADVVKMAGHACPTVTGAYLCCQTALKRLYGEEIPVRGEIAVTVYGSPGDGVYGVMAQVFSYITGAAGETGFKGLGPLFKRKDLLQFRPEKPDPEAMSFEFTRTDNGQSVMVNFYPQRIPFPPEKAVELGRLMQPVIWDAATEEETEKFHDLWMEKVENMLLRREDMEQWLTIKEKEAVK